MLVNNKNYQLNLSLLRVLACISVVILHSFKYSLALLNNTAIHSSDIQIVLSKGLQYIMNWAVPCFVMITGALLLDNNRIITFKKLFFKYILRIIIVIFLFSLVFQCIDNILSEKSIGFETIIIGIKKACFNGSWIHMWYLYMIIAIYLMLPIYRKFTQSANNKDMLYLLILYFIFLMILDVISNVKYTNVIMNQGYYTTSELINAINEAKYPAFYIFVQKVWPLYLFLGYAIHRDHLKIKPIISVIMIISSVLLILLFSILSEHTENRNLMTVLNVMCTFNSSPVYLFMSIGAFSFLHRYGDLKCQILRELVLKIDNCSFGIYLIHMIPISIVIAKLRVNPYDYCGIFGVLLFSIAVTLVSFIVVYPLKKIPLVKNIL